MPDDAPCEVLHETAGPAGEDYQLLRTSRIGHWREVVLVEVRRGAHVDSSSAAAYVLTPSRTWTEVARVLAAEWLNGTPRPDGVRDPQTARAVLDGLARDLLHRARDTLRG